MNNKLAPKNTDKEKAPDASTALLLKALLNIKSLLRDIGEGLLSPEFVKWLIEWDGKKFEKVEEIEVDVIGEDVVIKNGKATGNGKTRKLKTAIKIDNLLIVIFKGKNGKKEGFTFFPKKDGDRIVIFLDSKDVEDELRMKIVLFHELVHVKQLRDAEGGFKKIRDTLIDENQPKTDEKILEEINTKLRDNSEAEAHLATLFFAALLIQAHPEGEKAIREKYKTALGNLDDHQKDAKDQILLYQQILTTIGKLISDIKGENAKLKTQLTRLTNLKNKLQTELDRYKDSLPEMKESEKIKKRLDKLQKEIEKTDKCLRDFEQAKLAIIAKEAELRKKFREIVRKVAARKAKKEAILQETDKDKKDRLKNQLKEMKKELKELRKSTREDIKAINKDLQKASKKAITVQKAIKKSIGEIIIEIGKSEDDKLIDIFTLFIAAFRKSANRIKKIQFKLDLLKELEKVLGEILD